MVRIATLFHREFPAAEVVRFARAAEHAGFDDLWVIEDCFFTTGPSLAAAALTVTERLTVGLGILPAVARNPAFTAMEIATLCALGPARVVAGLGHGVPEWMAQIGEATASPLTTLDETTTAVRRLLHGETVTVTGREVRLDGVRLETPPSPPPPILLGVYGPKSLALAGRVADGVALAAPGGPGYVRWARAQCGGAPTTVVYAVAHVDADRMAARRVMAPLLADELTGTSRAMPLASHHDEAMAAAAEGIEAVVHLPDAWWHEVAAAGDADDVAAHVAGLVSAGADTVVLGATPELAAAREQLTRLGALLPRLRAT